MGDDSAEDARKRLVYEGIATRQDVADLRSHFDETLGRIVKEHLEPLKDLRTFVLIGVPEKGELGLAARVTVIEREREAERVAAKEAEAKRQLEVDRKLADARSERLQKAIKATVVEGLRALGYGGAMYGVVRYSK